MRQPGMQRFRYYTGPGLRPLPAAAPLRPLFRDIGPDASALFLAGRLPRWGGPLSPVLYLRTADWHEPYTETGAVGRLLFLRPRELTPWRTGDDEVFVGRVETGPGQGGAIYLPGVVCPDPAAHSARLAAFEARLEGCTDPAQAREALGGRLYDEELRDQGAALGRLVAARERVERWLGPVRRQLRAPTVRARDGARRWLEERGLEERDLCVAWHHLPPARRLRMEEQAR